MTTKYELLKQERDVLYNQMITSLNGISVPVNRMMTKCTKCKKDINNISTIIGYEELCLDCSNKRFKSLLKNKLKVE